MESLSTILDLADRKQAFMELVNSFLKGSSELRENIKSGWDFDVEWEYPDQRRLACSHGERYSCQKRIEASLAYYVIAEKSPGDVRDSLMGISVIYHSCLHGGLDPVKTFSRVAECSTSSVGDAMGAFPSRNEEDRSLDAFMLVKKMNADGEVELLQHWMV